ncbi:Signal transduction response regulator, receiver region domain protein [Candidatus Magnetobacterium bavaricum]|uniref:Adenylate cyclase n=1 Tax=Candidatus Magnetobacterium bavaricum TaxID=29290 RepID=D7GXF1_9BACT|nr:Signal transduction response regulator, receiver region domain protein [Candidatus Magnetobacterium bavaricum]CBL42941.1 adenylate cyclase [Candidatus Magnetobacterium bavaricum]
MSRQVLIVDDDVATRKFLSLVLEQKGYEVVMAENGAEGFNKAKEIKPDLIVLDVMMPKQNGISTLQEIRSNPELRDVPVIMLSSVESFIDQADKDIDDPEIIKEMRGLLEHVDSTIERFFLRYTSYRKILLMERKELIGRYRQKDAKLKPYMVLPDMFLDKPTDPETFIEAVTGLLSETI